MRCFFASTPTAFVNYGPEKHLQGLGCSEVLYSVCIKSSFKSFDAADLRSSLQVQTNPSRVEQGYRQLSLEVESQITT